MTTSLQGTPCWYELATSSPDGAQKFYAALLGWEVADAGMPGMDYRLARADSDTVAGIMAPQSPDMPPLWTVYFAVDNCDATAAAVTAAGGAVHHAPTDIPGTGRFAIVADPTGAAFGILAPLAADGSAFDQKKPGHGNWHELMSTDPKAALDFYTALLGWAPGGSMDMGEMGSYQMFSHNGADIGGMMRLGANMPGPGRSFWLPYFGTKSAAAAAEGVTANGGKVLMGPHQVPGGGFIVVGKDPQGAVFALTGPK